MPLDVAASIDSPRKEKMLHRYITAVEALQKLSFCIRGCGSNEVVTVYATYTEEGLRIRSICFDRRVGDHIERSLIERGVMADADVLMIAAESYARWHGISIRRRDANEMEATYSDCLRKFQFPSSTRIDDADYKPLGYSTQSAPDSIEPLTSELTWLTNTWPKLSPQVRKSLLTLLKSITDKA